MTGYNAFSQTRDTHGNVTDEHATVIDGKAVRDEDVAAAVVEAAQRVEKKKPEVPIGTRLNRLADNLREFQDAYDLAYRTWARAGSPLKSPSYDQRRSGKPASRTPTEAEAKTRVFLVLAAQRLAMSLRILARHNWLASKAWHPDSLQRHHVVMRDPWIAVPSFDNGEPAWRDASDVDVEPPDVTQGVSQLRGVVANLQSVEWEEADEADRDAVLDFLHESEEAVAHVNRTGAWFRGMPTDVAKVCSRKGCWREPTAGTTCQACTQKDYRERKKQERGAA